MDTGFDPHLHRVRDSFQRLLRATPVRVDRMPSPIPESAGIYVFYENDEPLRVGTTKKNLRKRVKQHHGSNPRNAALAKLLPAKQPALRGRIGKGRTGRTR